MVLNLVSTSQAWRFPEVRSASIAWRTQVVRFYSGLEVDHIHSNRLVRNSNESGVIRISFGFVEESI